MLKNKKFLLTFLMIVLTVTIIGCSGDKDSNGGVEFNEEGSPVVDEDTDFTLSVAGGTRPTGGADWDSMEMIKKLEEKTNVKLDLRLTPSVDWSEKRSVLLGTDDLPDVLLQVSDNEAVEYGDQGTLIALNDLIDEYAPNIKKMLEEAPEVRKQVTAPDGNIYVIPRANMAPWEATNGNLLWINKKWLDDLGLDMPKTLDDFKEALIAFRDNDMNGNGDEDDELPFSFEEPSTNGGLQKPIFTSFDTEHQSNRIIVRDKGGEDKVEYVSATEQFKEGVKYLRELWEEDLIDPESFSYNAQQHRAKLSQDPPVAGAFAGTHPDSQVQNPDSKWDYDLILPPLEGPDGHSSLAQNNHFISNAFSITSANENPELTMRWLDHMYEEEMSLDVRYGPNAYEIEDDGTITMIAPEDGLTEAEWQYLESPSNDWGYYISEELADRLEFADVENAELLYKRPEFIETSEEYVVDRKYPALMNSLEELEVLGDVETTMHEYTGEKMAEWITEGGIEEEWDDYLEELDAMGLQEALEIYQDAYDRYQES